jgi:hypothetical protein
MTPEQLTAAVLFIITLLGAISSVWWRIEGRVDRAKAEAVLKATEAATEAASVRADLAAHKLHTAETYATKQGMQEQTSQLLRAIEGVSNRIEGMNERLDRAFETQPSRRSTRTA